MISIIVPIYNTEKTLCKCIDSILEQTYQDFELILVNDGSTDRSESICLDYAKRYGNFVSYYKKNNGGVSSARNYGIEQSKGEYICFVDSDDYVEATYLEVLLSSLIEYKVEFSMCDVYGNEKNKTKDVIHLYDRNDIITAIISNKYGSLNRGPYCKLFLKKIIDDLRFDENIYLGEDTLFCIEYAKRCKNGIYARYGLYHYEFSTSSVAYRSDVRMLKKYLTYIDSRRKMLCDTMMINRNSYRLLANSLFESVQESYFLARQYSNKSIQYTLCSLMKDFLAEYKIGFIARNKPVSWFIMANFPKRFDMWMLLYGKYHGFLNKLGIQ